MNIFYNQRFFTINYIFDTTWCSKKVFEEVSTIRIGQVKLYKEISIILKNKNAYRSVANARNPLPIIIPCHRVIKSSGKIGSYKGGHTNKKYLLSLENKTGNFY